MEITLDIDVELLERMEEIADFQQISLNNAIVALIMQHVSSHNRIDEIYKQGVKDGVAKASGARARGRVISISR